MLRAALLACCVASLSGRSNGFLVFPPRHCRASTALMAADTADPYAVLGVPSDATEKEIKRAFRQVARRCHPDVLANEEATEQQQDTAAAQLLAAQEASAVLLDRDERARLDARRAVMGEGDLGALMGEVNLGALLPPAFEAPLARVAPAARAVARAAVDATAGVTVAADATLDRRALDMARAREAAADDASTAPSSPEAAAEERRRGRTSWSRKKERPQLGDRVAQLGAQLGAARARTGVELDDALLDAVGNALGAAAVGGDAKGAEEVKAHRALRDELGAARYDAYMDRVEATRTARREDLRSVRTLLGDLRRRFEEPEVPQLAPAPPSRAANAPDYRRER